MKIAFSQQLLGGFRVLGGRVYGRLSALEGSVFHCGLLGKISHSWKENGIQVNALLCLWLWNALADGIVEAGFLYR